MNGPGDGIAMAFDHSNMAYVIVPPDEASNEKIGPEHKATVARGAAARKGRDRSADQIVAPF
jgi:hypothetical protein